MTPSQIHTEAPQATTFLSRREVDKSFAGLEKAVFSPSEIRRFVEKNKGAWIIEAQDDRRSKTVHNRALIPLQSSSQNGILDALVHNTLLQKVQLPFPYRADTRFTWGEASAYQLIQSLDPKGYFSHYTAMHLHSLTEQIPKTLYFNVEQPASGGGGKLSQESIDRAFRAKCRVSGNVIRFRNLRISKLNGGNTGQLGIISLSTDDEEDIRVTDIERTLIDAVVRPVYAGGIGEVAHAFHAAADRVSVKRLASYLRKLEYTYPYHQAIGFYMDRSGGYKKSDINLMRRFPREFDFYLTYQLKNPAYNERWRLYTPQRF